MKPTEKENRQADLRYAQELSIGILLLSRCWHSERPTEGDGIPSVWFHPPPKQVSVNPVSQQLNQLPDRFSDPAQHRLGAGPPFIPAIC